MQIMQNWLEYYMSNDDFIDLSQLEAQNVHLLLIDVNFDHPVNILSVLYKIIINFSFATNL